MVVQPRAMKRLEFKNGLSYVSVDGAFFYVNRNGKTARALPFDNGPDPFVEGLARTMDERKVGFIDRSLRIAIPARWDFAFPFHDGVAVVCGGCRAAAGEHRNVEGGLWGYIDRRGRVVVPIEYPKEKLPTNDEARRKRPRNGS